MSIKLWFQAEDPGHYYPSLPDSKRQSIRDVTGRKLNPKGTPILRYK
jgi:hypothetical protein